VVRDVAAYEIVGGNPATSLGYRFNPEQIAALLEIAWWNWPLEKIKQEIRRLESDQIDEFIRRHRSSGGDTKI
jgi:virginiamycin A acetyltransferase